MINPQPNNPRQSRHLDILEELATLAMALTRAAAHKAQAHLEDPAPEPAPSVATDPVLTFTRLATTVRQLIALEARIANPKSPTTPNRTPTTPKPVDDARELIAEAVRACAKADPAAIKRHGPTKTHIERHIDDRIEADDITDMIDDNERLACMVMTVCQDLDIRFDVAQQPDINLRPIAEAIQRRRNARNPQPSPPRDSTGAGNHASATPPTTRRPGDPTEYQRQPRT